MSRVQEIEEIAQTSPQTFSDVARWILEVDQKRWDGQMDSDAAAGKLDFLRAK